jgi:hypothetical protein
MAQDKLFSRLAVLVAPAVIGAHVNAPAGIGFRQRDVRWLIEFFSNWIESSLDPEGIPLKNTQIARYLEELVNDGFAKKIIRKNKPRYYLTPFGIVELMHRVVDRQYYPQREHFFLLYTFLINYQPRIKEVIQAEKKRFPYALQLEVEELADSDALIERQLFYTQRELKKLEKRISDQVGTAKLTKELLAQRMDYKQLAEEVEKRFPFSLYTKKPLRQLLSDTTRKFGVWELSVGGLRRKVLMWEQMKQMLELHIEQLEALKKLDASSWSEMETSF